MKNLEKAKSLGLTSMVWLTPRGETAPRVCTAAWPYVGYGRTEEESLDNLIQNIEQKKEYNA